MCNVGTQQTTGTESWSVLSFTLLHDEVPKHEAMGRTHTTLPMDSQISDPADLSQLLPLLYYSVFGKSLCT
jgi:hypothetical protein